jgi:hypothetical protein
LDSICPLDSGKIVAFAAAVNNSAWRCFDDGLMSADLKTHLSKASKQAQFSH